MYIPQKYAYVVLLISLTFCGIETGVILVSLIFWIRFLYFNFNIFSCIFHFIDLFADVGVIYYDYYFSFT